MPGITHTRLSAALEAATMLYCHLLCDDSTAAAAAPMVANVEEQGSSDQCRTNTEGILCIVLFSTALTIMLEQSTKTGPGVVHGGLR